MMADGMPPRFAEQDGITVDLAQVYDALRHGVEIRNRSSMKRLHKNSFVGTAAVGFLVKEGLAPSRAKAVTLGRVLQDKGYLRHVTDQSKFKDAQLYYRFYGDEEAKHASLNEVSLGTLGHPGVSPDGRTWGFAPHTAHNSLVLDLSFAEYLETELQAPSVARRGVALEELRKRVREQVSPHCEGWEDVKVSTRPGPLPGQTVRTRVWTRTRPRGNFANLKTEGVIGVSPDEFMQDFLDLEKRPQWDGGRAGVRTDGTVVEAVFTSKAEAAAAKPVFDDTADNARAAAANGGGLGSGEKKGGGGLLGMLTPALPKPPSSPSPPAAPSKSGGLGSLTAAYSSAGLVMRSDPSSTNGGRDDDDDEAGAKGGGGGAFTTLRPPPAWGVVDLSSCPENMSIANFGGDAKKEETTRHVNRGIHSGRVEECMLCAKPFSEDDTRDLHDCPSCGSICCSFCCSKRVFEVVFENEMRVCIHCYQESSRIKHPIGTLAYASSKGLSTQDFLSMAEIKQALEEEANAEMEKERLETEERAAARGSVAVVQIEVDVEPPSSSSTGSAGSLAKEGHGGGDEDDDDEGEALEELDDLKNEDNAHTGEGDVSVNGPLSSLSLEAVKEEPEDEGGEQAAEVGADDNNGGGLCRAGDSAGLFGVAKMKPTKAKKAGGIRFSPSVSGGEGGTGAVAAKVGLEKERQKWATCKQCGTRVPRTLEAIEMHDETCEATQVSSTSRATSVSAAAAGVLFPSSPSSLPSSSPSSSSASRRALSTNGLVSTLLSGFSKHGSGNRESNAKANDDADDGGVGAGSSSSSSSHGGGGSGGGSGFLLGGVPRVYPSEECALGERERLALVGATARIMFRTREPGGGGSGSGGGVSGGGGDNGSSSSRAPASVSSAAASFVRPRQVCCLQDSFKDDATGTCVVYEISVRHRRVAKESSQHVTAEVLFMAHAARPLQGLGIGGSGESGSGSDKAAASAAGSLLTVVSQVDAKSSHKWISTLFGQDQNYSRLGGLDVFNEFATAEGVEALDFTSNSAAPSTPAANAAKAPAGGAGEGQQQRQAVVLVDACVVPKVSLADFELMTVLGRGGFGKVMQVRHKASDEVFAMKIFKKNELRKRKQVERTKTERDILSSVRHPYIVQLSYAFQNKEKLYMVMDFVQGGDFFTFMRKFGKLKESWVQLYVCQIALALQHLHELEVVYRDLKPENVLMDGQGHVKLTDFGLSRSFDKRPALPEDLPAALNHAVGVANKQQEQEQQQGNGGRGSAGGAVQTPPPTTAGGLPDAAVATSKTSRSYCGTEQYMAPEMLLQRGHGRVVDWWCLGLLMHEMLTGKHPFQGASHYDTLRGMVTAEPVIDPRVSPTARALVRRLLIKDPKRRLGAQRGAWIEIRPHPFFNGLDWDSVLKRSVPAPYCPQVSGATGTENFEDVFTKEKPVDSVVEPSGGKKGGGRNAKGGGKGLWSGIFGSKGRYQEEEDNDFEGFSFHGGDNGEGKSVLG